MSKKHPYHDDSMWKGAPPENFAKAKDLRKNTTEAEKALWEKLKQKQLGGYKFRRQHPIHKFIVDFYCHKLKLVVEVDGGYHNEPEQRGKDKKRTELLESQGVKVIRFSNDDVLKRISDVIEKIKKEITQIINNT